MTVKVVNTSGNALPAYATPLSAGVDLRAALEAPVELKPLERALVPTGLYMQIPAGYEGQVRPRSGLAAKHGITVLNTPGTIDADYRGEIKVILVNLSDLPVHHRPGGAHRPDGVRPLRAGPARGGRVPGRDGTGCGRFRQYGREIIGLWISRLCTNATSPAEAW